MMQDEKQSSGKNDSVLDTVADAVDVVSEATVATLDVATTVAAAAEGVSVIVSVVGEVALIVIDAATSAFG